MAIAKTKKHEDIRKNMYSGVFEVADVTSRGIIYFIFPNGTQRYC